MACDINIGFGKVKLWIRREGSTNVSNHTFCCSTGGSIKLNLVNCLQLDVTIRITGIIRG
ncbi:unnamed protein product [Tetraodon nigroviridis]|uniref:(spotted green pufferfish) hypothetical protein n=1 Tax=Tetraodon nigroviridis TaxID=99883 RepID=Q4RQY6_TETNG|nr:unnamed protein product [Tetraodon nigroviridis]